MVSAPCLSAAAIYVGTLRHRRFSPVLHGFSYPLFMVMLDVDRIDEQMRVSPFTSRNRWNWASFDDRDHFGNPDQPLRERLTVDAARHGVRLPDGPIRLVTHLRYLGYCFNPVSFFYCFNRGEKLQLVLAEVNNTFGESHNYWLAPSTPHATDRPGPSCPAPGASHTAPGTFRSAARKSLYVSPYMEANLEYGFAFTPPGNGLVAHMTVSGAAHRLFDATLTLERRPWTAEEIRRVLVRHPFMTAKVIGAIHLEAFRLWWKGVRVVPRPTPRATIAVERPAPLKPRRPTGT